jgi:hypothetical protein
VRPLALAVLLGVPAWGGGSGPDSLSAAQKRALCLREITPESMIVHQFGDNSREGLYDFATCTELVKKEASMCAYFPGGPAARFEPALSLRRYKVVGEDARTHLVYEYGVCDSRSAGYLLLAGLVAGEPRDKLLPYARRMLNAEPVVRAEDLVDVSSAIYHAGALESRLLPDLVRKGFFNYLLGRKACGPVKAKGLRRECEWKGAALDALLRGDPALCVPTDLMCRAMFDGEKACRAVGREAVRVFCTKEFPLLNPNDAQWNVMRSRL